MCRTTLPASEFGLLTVEAIMDIQHYVWVPQPDIAGGWVQNDEHELSRWWRDGLDNVAMIFRMTFFRPQIRHDDFSISATSFPMKRE